MQIASISLEILRDVGIRIPCEKALALFRRYGFKVDGAIVRFEEKDIINSACQCSPTKRSVSRPLVRLHPLTHSKCSYPIASSLSFSGIRLKILFGFI